MDRAVAFQRGLAGYRRSLGRTSSNCPQASSINATRRFRLSPKLSLESGPGAAVMVENSIPGVFAQIVNRRRSRRVVAGEGRRLRAHISSRQEHLCWGSVECGRNGFSAGRILHGLGDNMSELVEHGAWLRDR